MSLLSEKTAKQPIQGSVAAGSEQVQNKPAAEIVELPQAGSLADLLFRHRALLGSMRQASADPRQWTAVQKDPAYGQLLVEMKAAMLRDGGYGPVPVQIARATGLNPAEFRELTRVSTGLLRAGDWLPVTARMQRMADDSKKTEVGKDEDALSAALSAMSRAKIPGTNVRFVPPVVETNKGTPLLKPLYGIAKHGLDVIDGIGKSINGGVTFPGGHFPGLYQLATYFAAAGDEKATELQLQYRALAKALKPLKVGWFGTGSKLAALRQRSEAEQQMIGMTAAVIYDLAIDLDRLMQFIRDPSSRHDLNSALSLQNASRFTLHSLADLCLGLAKGVDAGTDPNSWRLFTLNLSGGGALMVAACAVGGGMGLVTPSLAEVERTGKVTTRFDFAYPSVTSPIGGAMLGSRGGKYNVKFPLIGVRRSEYSQAVKFGIPFLFGVSFHRDEVLGSGIELALFPKWGMQGIFEVRAGGNAVVFHPGLGFLDRPVEITARVLGEAIDWTAGWARACTTWAARTRIGEHVVRAGKASGAAVAKLAVGIGKTAAKMAKAVRGGTHWLSSRMAALADQLGWEGPKAKLDAKHAAAEAAAAAAAANPPVPVAPQAQPTPEEMLARSRLGNSAVEVRRAEAALRTIARYREALASADGPFNERALDYRQMVEGFGKDKATDIISKYLAEIEGRFQAQVTRVDEMLAKPELPPFAERDLRSQLRRQAAKLHGELKLFDFADLLLAQVFAMPAPAVAAAPATAP